MPCELANGLLPGRGPLGRGAPGRGADASPGVEAGFASGALGAAAFGSAGCVSAFAAALAAGAGLGAAGFGAVAPAGTVAGVPACFDAGVATGFAGSAPGFAPSEARAALSLRATGGSMLDDGPLTNSPSSLSFASATLLSTPSSLAISCTRGFAATILLFGTCPSRGKP
jgi:hypothetical protein